LRSAISCTSVTLTEGHALSWSTFCSRPRTRLDRVLIVLAMQTFPSCDSLPRVSIRKAAGVNSRTTWPARSFVPSRRSNKSR
jgi:hypothetical protein